MGVEEHLAAAAILSLCLKCHPPPHEQQNRTDDARKREEGSGWVLQGQEELVG